MFSRLHARDFCTRFTRRLFKRHGAMKPGGLRMLAQTAVLWLAVSSTAAVYAVPIPENGDRFTVNFDGESYRLARSQGGFPAGTRDYLLEGQDFSNWRERVSLITLGPAIEVARLTEFARTFFKGLEDVCDQLNITGLDAIPEPPVRRLSLSFAALCLTGEEARNREDYLSSVEYGLYRFIATRTGVYLVHFAWHDDTVPDEEGLKSLTQRGQKLTQQVSVCDILLEAPCDIDRIQSGAASMAQLDIRATLSASEDRKPVAAITLSLGTDDIKDSKALEERLAQIGFLLQGGVEGVRLRLLMGETDVTAEARQASYSFLSSLDNLVRHHGLSTRTRLRLINFIPGPPQATAPIPQH